MGTNYYIEYKVCQTCGHPEKERHIGKSSWGWCFALHVYPEDGINNLNDWLREMRSDAVRIRNEYGETIDCTEMFSTIRERKSENRDWSKPPYLYHTWEEFHERNFSEQGPNGLLRHKLGPFCIGHGDGPWDYIVGEFS